MSRPRFLVDADVNRQIIEGALRAEPLIEFVNIRDTHLRASPDNEILEVAAREGLLTFSHDVHTMTAATYARIAAGLKMPGLFVIPQHRPAAMGIEQLLLIWSASEAEDWDGTVNFLPLK